jgi:peptidyl-prolyl cis-trans isomerase SurA
MMLTKMRSLLFALLLMTMGLESTAQVNLPIFTYGIDTVYSDEFMRGFSKNNRNSDNPTEAEIRDYLQLYIRFKLKVTEAYNLQMDTVPSFKTELAGYRKQLAQPYLTDKSVNEKLIMEAYERGKEEINASHILILLDPGVSPADTAAAYQKIMGLRNRVLNEGQNFEDVAKEFSEDRSAVQNNGNLGYFTAFQMIYPFETAAFNTEVGKVSMPFRTQFGYHLVKVNDRRKVLGDVKVAHIMIKFYNATEVDSAKRRINAVFAKLQSGADWTTMVSEFSDDYNSVPSGGEINWFNRTTSNIPDEFKDQAQAIQNVGDYTKPFRTKYGWHILKLVDKKPEPQFESLKESIRRKVERDSRSELNKTVVISRVKVENKFNDREVLSDLMPYFDSTLLIGRWSTPANAIADLVLFTIMDEEYSSALFYKYIELHQARSGGSIESTVQNLYNAFVDDMNLKYEEAHLEEKYDDFKYIMQEYKDGILLFELMNKEVWTKAIEDTAGLEAYYLRNSEKYMYPERVNAQIFSCSDKKTAKKAMKMAKKGMSIEEIQTALNVDDALAVTVNSDKFEPGENKAIDSLPKKPGVYMIPMENGRYKFVRIIEVIPPQLKDLSKNLGQATSDYQNELEAQWIQNLMKKYPVRVFEENVKTLHN